MSATFISLLVVKNIKCPFFHEFQHMKGSKGKKVTVFRLGAPGIEWNK